MNIDTILSEMLNGEPLHDGIIIGIMFIMFYTFFKELFSGMFSIFR